MYVLARNDEWIIKREKSEKASFTFPNKKDAIDKAFEMAEEDHVNVTIYGSDGKIQTRRSFVK